MDSFEEELASLNDAGSLMSLPLDFGDENKTDSATAVAAYDTVVNGPGPSGAPSALNGSFQQLILENEIPVHDPSCQEVATLDKKIMTAQDFYSSTVPHDQLSSAQRFEI
ncbi:hypothetical protein DD237_007300 [Peronospora effusa]|uniref:Uncharacterized protein n=1 Tax=Peronospora effusa TaxID=542832 RepID=A0A3R7XNH6_9STRA|nr:hypothetical protein DD237_007300 [Peronospora effusa]